MKSAFKQIIQLFIGMVVNAILSAIVVKIADKIHDKYFTKHLCVLCGGTGKRLSNGKYIVCECRSKRRFL